MYFESKNQYLFYLLSNACLKDYIYQFTLIPGYKNEEHEIS